MNHRDEARTSMLEGDVTFIARTPIMCALHEEVRVAAASDLNVLLLGESGTGKEVFAEMVHRHSARARGPQVRLNCAAFSESLFEAELFGYEAGAFTGAQRAKPGLLELAEGGTVFFDEISEMPLSLQAKLLRVFDERKTLRVGSVRTRAIDVRFVAATNRDLNREVRQGRFRHDLLFRLNGISVRIPPLRQRKDDIAPLVEHYARQASLHSNRTTVPRISAEALELLEQYDWPGNVRELRNVIERAIAFCAQDEVMPEHIRIDGPSNMRYVPLMAAAPAMADASTRSATNENDGIEGQRIREALDLCAGNQTAAASMLGISRRTLVYKLDRYGFARPRKSAMAKHQMARVR